MKNLAITSDGKNHTSIDIGKFSDLMDYAYLNSKMNLEVKGKVFVGEILKTSGSEISFQLMLPNTEIAFLHKHNKHEEIYLVIKGAGQFLVDGKVINLREGSIVRVAPDGERTLRNNTLQPMVYMVIQTMNNSIDNHYVEDGYRVDTKVSWE